ncbi:MAG: NAD(P)/FAD-dependent oxidoreductase [Hyphomicrobiaceae bacterium]
MQPRLRIAVIGSGISGLSAAWLLSRRHEVTLMEAEARPGGHSHTFDVSAHGRTIPVDTGFIVYNPESYPNLVALFDRLSVPTTSTNMSFAVSMSGGAYEYAGSGVHTLFGQARNLIRPAHWRMVLDTLRFFREAPELLAADAAASETLGAYLSRRGYSSSFVTRHIAPMAAAIWSTPAVKVLDFPAAAFVRFFANHGLLRLKGRPQWRTVVGGSRAYVRRLLADTKSEQVMGARAQRITRTHCGISIRSARGLRHFDACVIATHADEALRMLGDADGEERRLLGAFRYVTNHVVLHQDERVMPRRRRLWSSWNYTADPGEGAQPASVTYWMNSLQPLGERAPNLFVSLNPGAAIAPSKIVATFRYAHPVFDAASIEAQRDLWRLQGRRNTWFCGSYFGYGFHEDGLQSGLAVAEDIGGVRRPWSVPNESDRLHLAPAVERFPVHAVEAAE